MPQHALSSGFDRLGHPVGSVRWRGKQHVRHDGILGGLPGVRNAQETGATVLVIHHVRKSSASERPDSRPLAESLNPENLRGASAIEGRARFVLLMTALQAQEVQKIGLSTEEAEREAFVVLASVKQSAAAKGAWLLLERSGPDRADAGMLHPHSESGELVQLLRGKDGTKGKTKQSTPRYLLLLQAIAFAGAMDQVNRENVASVLWPSEGYSSKRWDKLLEMLRAKGFLQGRIITDHGKEALLLPAFHPRTPKSMHFQGWLLSMV